MSDTTVPDDTDTPVVVDRMVIDEPGVYDLTPEQYHTAHVLDGSLSYSGAKLLLPPSCPAKYKTAVTIGRPPKRIFDFGHAAHREVLGIGAQLHVIDADNYNRKATQQARDKARGAGEIPLLREEHQRVQEMAVALREHPYAGPLLQAGNGVAEQALFWRDPDTGLMLRAMLDWITTLDSGQLVIVDYKSCDSASPGAISRDVAKFCYHMQDAFYTEGAAQLDLSETPAFVFVFQEKTPPYLITIVQLDDDTRYRGRRRNRAAIDTYLRCRDADRWPGYTDGIESVGLPGWATYQDDAAWRRGDYDITPHLDTTGDVT